MTARTPSLQQVVRSAIEQDRATLRTVVPAQVVAYNPATQTASVSPTRLARTSEGVPIEPVVIADRPVVWPRGGGYVVSWDLLPGDDVLLLCCDREADGVLYGAPGVPATPQRSRMHSLSDAIVLPGLSRITSPPTEPRLPGTMYLGSETGAASVTVSAAGVALGQPAAVDAVVLAQALTAQLIAAITAAPTVPMDGGAAFKTGLIAQLSAPTFAQAIGATLVRGI